MTTIVPIIDLAQAVRVAVAAATGKTVSRRYAPHFDKKDPELQAGEWFVVVTAEDLRKKRHTQFPRLTVELAYQRALPDSTTEFKDPLSNLPFLDGCMAEVQGVKNLFGEGGSLQRKILAECDLADVSNNPLYRPDLLYDLSIFTSVIKLEYDYSIDSDD
jgi:hypothetical protein